MGGEPFSRGGGVGRCELELDEERESALFCGRVGWNGSVFSNVGERGERDDERAASSTGAPAAGALTLIGLPGDGARRIAIVDDWFEDG